ncbi:unknown protein [Desulfotalea psychrophila LSv54]|uniref:Uncharacterized protein n=1 Tax=Desulfotalea psychrophila (strain LSv54 / DSM 12343) TaxID=177439 RepID=Q6AK29_DESPS|nr:unknown protein [Desulfotalea psychrophila LSv54]
MITPRHEQLPWKHGPPPDFQTVVPPQKEKNMNSYETSNIIFALCIQQGIVINVTCILSRTLLKYYNKGLSENNMNILHLSFGPSYFGTDPRYNKLKFEKWMSGNCFPFRHFKQRSVQ